mmetsp:Transcript_98842/g.288335  ORF Transcript_98842/g.288335 Transcript_98842/m.288335 type:complete len:422 (-) Transcript_98842:37-1302(-)
MALLHRAVLGYTSAVVAFASLTDETSFIQVGSTLEARLASRDVIATDLVEFRDAVVKRPTPPLASVPIPEIEEMKQPSAQTPMRQAMMCSILNWKLRKTPAMQEPMYVQGGHEQAIKAMKLFATDAFVQTTCSGFMGNMVQWNWVLARALGDAGALDLIITAMRNFPEEESVRALTSDLGAFCDFDNENRKRVVELGGLDLVYQATDMHYTTRDVEQMYNLWAAMSGSPEVVEQMVERDELERGLKAMRAHRRGTVRGEVMQLNLALFMHNESHKERLLKAGIVPEIVSAMRDEISGAQGELDAVGKPRLLSNAIKILTELARGGPQHRTEILEAGSLEQIMNALHDLTAHGDKIQHGFAEMQHDLRTEACEVMTQLMGNSPDEHQQFLKYRSLAQLPSILKDPFFETELPTPCSELLKQL